MPIRSGGHVKSQPMFNGSHDSPVRQLRPPPGLEVVQEPVRSGGQAKSQPMSDGQLRPPPGLEQVKAPVRLACSTSRMEIPKEPIGPPGVFDQPHGIKAQPIQPPGLFDQPHGIKAQPVQPPGSFDRRMEIPKEHAAGVAAYYDYISNIVAVSTNHRASVVAHHADITRCVMSASAGWQSTGYDYNMSGYVHMRAESGYMRSVYGVPDHLSDTASEQELYSSEAASSPRTVGSDYGSPYAAY